MKEQKRHNILYSCTGKLKMGHEPFVEEHALAYVVSGEMQFHTADGMLCFPKGSIAFVRKNQLVKAVKFPDADKPFMSVSVLFKHELLQMYSTNNKIKKTGVYIGESIINITADSFMKGYFNSLLPYFDEPEQMTASIANIKTSEAIELLLRNPFMKNLLFDFNEPFKIDLEAFMNNHFTYNVPLSQFARITGRSLSTFQRHFARIFGAPPEKWLVKRRLEQAHFLMTQKGMRPSEVYLEVGFENLSHFSVAFKKEFGVNASQVTIKRICARLV